MFNDVSKPQSFQEKSLIPGSAAGHIPMKSRLVQPLYKRGFSVVLLDLPGSGGSGLNTNTQVDGGCVFSAETTGSSLQNWDVIMKTWKWTIQDQDLKVLKCGEPFLRTFLRIILRRNLEATVNYPKMVGQVPLFVTKKWEHIWAEDDFESWDPGALWGLGGGGFPDCGKCIACLGFPKPLIVPPWKLADWEKSPIFAPHLMGDAAPWQSTGEEQANRFIFRH